MNDAPRTPFDLHAVRVAAIYLVCLQHVAHLLPRVVTGLSPEFPDLLRNGLTIAGLGAFLVLSGMSLSITYQPVQSATAGTAHLFITNPLKGEDSVGWFASLFDTHPPMKDRIHALQEMEGNLS